MEPYELRATPTAIQGERIGRVVRVHVSFSQVALDSSEPQLQVFSIDCTFEACYQLEEGYEPTATEVKAFSEGNVLFNVWPYARQFLHDMSTRMAHNPPPLPLLRFVPQPADQTPALPPT